MQSFIGEIFAKAFYSQVMEGFCLHECYVSYFTNFNLIEFYVLGKRLNAGAEKVDDNLQSK